MSDENFRTREMTAKASSFKLKRKNLTVFWNRPSIFRKTGFHDTMKECTKTRDRRLWAPKNHKYSKLGNVYSGKWKVDIEPHSCAVRSPNNQYPRDRLHFTSSRWKPGVWLAYLRNSNVRDFECPASQNNSSKRTSLLGVSRGTSVVQSSIFFSFEITV